MNKNYKAQTIQLAMSKRQNTKMHPETENNKGVGKITENNNHNDELSEMQRKQRNVGVGKIAENNNCNDVLSEM